MPSLSKRSFFYKLYILVFGSEPNDNFCDYFWGLVVALLMIPLSFPVFLVVFLYALWFSEKHKYDTQMLVYKKRTLNERLESSSLKLSGNIYATVVLIVFILFNILMYQDGFIIKAYIITLIAVSLIAGIFYTIFRLQDSEKVGDFVENIIDLKEIASTRWHSFKDKYCPKINWKE